VRWKKKARNNTASKPRNPVGTKKANGYLVMGFLDANLVMFCQGTWQYSAGPFSFANLRASLVVARRRSAM
jgi:hypothetical protein